MRDTAEFLGDTLTTGTVATVATAVAASTCGAVEGLPLAAPVNVISHIVWGDEAASKNDVSAQYTLTGLGLHTTAIMSWAALYEGMFGRKARNGDVATALIGGAVVSALAYVTDYYVVPRRLTPGFEKRLTGTSLFTIFAVLALSLGAGGLINAARAQGVPSDPTQAPMNPSL